MNKYEVSDIHTSFKVFNQKMNHIWEEYNYLSNVIKNSKKEPYNLESLYASKTLTKDKNDAGGMYNRFLKGENAKNHFIDAISTFEDYISKLSILVYKSYPQKMQGTNNDKIFDVILKYQRKEDMINYIATERVRSIFYGNPVDVFLKDKCQFGLEDTFSTKYANTMELYKEITGRRNIIIHNLGRVDNKYLKENPDSSFVLKQKIKITQEYLRGTIALLIGISAITTEVVIKNIYKGQVGGRLKESVEKFKKCYQKGWYENLLNK